MDEPSYRYEAYVRCTEEEAWQAITDPKKTAAYYYGTSVNSDWKPGSPVQYFSPGGDLVADGQILAIEPPHRLEMTFTVRWDPELETEGATPNGVDRWDKRTNHPVGGRVLRPGSR